MISITCPNCRTPFTVPDNLAGKNVACTRCNALIPVQSQFAARPMPTGAVTGYDRVLGKPTPAVLEVLGIYAKFNADGGGREIFKLVWSLRHIALVIALLICWVNYAATAVSAELSAPIFFAISLALIFGSWYQISVTSRKLANSIGAQGSSSILPHILSSLLLITSDWRAAMPAMRTFFLGGLTLVAAISLASEAGGMSKLLPLSSLPSFTTPPGNKPAPKATQTPSETPTPEVPEPPPVTTAPVVTPPATLPKPPTDEKPIPPPEDTTPIPPPP